MHQNADRSHRANRPAHVCQHCGAAAVRRSHSRWFEAWLKLVMKLRPYRCGACGRRGWAEPDRAPDEERAAHRVEPPEIIDPPDLSDVDETTIASAGVDAHHKWNVPLAALDAAETFKPTHD